MNKYKLVYTVIIQNWEESDRRCLGIRPNGFTIHIDKEHHKKYVSWYNKKFNNHEDGIPDKYTRVYGDPIEIEVSDELYERIKKASQHNMVPGAGRVFSRVPMRTLKETDVDWPPFSDHCDSCHRPKTECKNLHSEECKAFEALYDLWTHFHSGRGDRNCVMVAAETILACAGSIHEK